MAAKNATANHSRCARPVPVFLGRFNIETRLESEKEMIGAGAAGYSSAADSGAESESADEGERSVHIAEGSSSSDLVAVCGAPSEGNLEQPDGDLTWYLSSGRVRIAAIAEGEVKCVVERMPWGEEMVVVQ